jgi:ribosomal protein L12E/L44/L45/RPP1/RPP2
MELIIGLIVIVVVGYFVFFRNSEKTVVEAAPYKIETVQAPTPVAEQASQAVVESIAPAKKPRATKPATAKKPAAKKVAAKKTAAKKPKAK